MTWDELHGMLNISNIRIELIKPLRNDSHHTVGSFAGFKSGLFGGGHSKFKNGIAHSYDSRKRHYIKRPMICIAYDIFDYGGKQHSDWVDIDNCIFTIETN